MDEEQLPKQSSSIGIKEFLWLCLSKWYLFVIALVLSCGYAVYYLAKTPKVYIATSAIVVKDDATGSSGPDIAEVFSDMKSFNTSVNLNNEMVAMKSPVIVDEVSHRLGLDVNYSVKEKLTDKILYGTTLPATIQFLDLGEDGVAHTKMKYDGEGKLIIGPFANDDSSLETQGSGENIEIDLTENKTDTVQSPVGRLAVTLNENYLPASRNNGIDIKVDRIGYDASVRRLLSTLNTEVRDKYSSVIYITLSDTNTERAKDELAALIEVYNENWIKDRNQISVSTSNFIDERLGVIEAELGDVDSQISDYQAAHQLPTSGTSSDAFLQRKNTADDEIGALAVKIDLARRIKNSLTSAASSFQQLPSATALGSSSLEPQIIAYNEALLDRNLAVQNSSESNPLVMDMDAKLDVMRKGILSQIDGIILGFNAEMQAKQRTLNQAASQLSSTPTQAKHLLDKERQQKVKESLYLYLLQKREENELSQAFTAYNTKVVQTPTVTGPVSPDSKKILTMAVALGLLVPGGLIFLLEMMNSKVRGRRDIEKLTIPFVGEVPLSGKQPKRKFAFGKNKQPIDRSGDIVVKKGSNNVINEAFRVIRTNLEFMLPGDKTVSRVLMVTSANPGSGKTFIALNLATVLALKGKRVALVDLDLRKGSLSKAVEAKGQGMSNYLVGGVSADDIVIKNAGGTEHLDMYPSGPIPPNPSELLYSERLKTLMEQLRQEYDYVIVDGPPAEVVADAKIINQWTDVTLFIIRAGLLERTMLSEIQRFYNDNRYKNMAIILNGTIDPTTSRINRANRFGYGYGYYGYGYVKGENQ
ncbi:MAG: polysaccharide biosynthesis tyrosine autokinase [Bacteroides sp.]|nr:polysaccharide biosynthesis tyrosine autokinase [Bacteroides sp.]